MFLQIVLWVNQNFLLKTDVTLTGLELELCFKALRTKHLLFFCVSSDNRITIYCDDMGLVGELTQSLAAFLNVNDLEVRYFTYLWKRKFQKYVQTFLQVEKLNILD